MKTTGIVRKVDPVGRIVIPTELRRLMDIKISDRVEIFVENDAIFFKKYRATGACLVTGEILEENKVFAPGLILSPKGAEILLKELQSKTI